jgi:hypothetical protein
VNPFAEKENARIEGWKDLFSIEINNVISCVSSIFAFLTQVLSFRENYTASKIVEILISNFRYITNIAKKCFYNSCTLNGHLHMQDTSAEFWYALLVTFYLLGSNWPLLIFSPSQNYLLGSYRIHKEVINPPSSSL